MYTHHRTHTRFASHFGTSTLSVQLKIRPGDEKLAYALKQTTVNGVTSYVHESPTRFKLVARECQKVDTCEAAEDEGNVVQQGE